MKISIGFAIAFLMGCVATAFLGSFDAKTSGIRRLSTAADQAIPQQFLSLPNITYKLSSFQDLITEYIPPQEQVKVVVNIGAQDGKYHDPTYPLMKEHNYQGVVFEGDENYKDILKNNLAGITPEPKISWGYIKTADAVARLQANGVPLKFDALKIDIDSFDAQLADVILGAGYRPQVVMVEFNPDIPPPFAWHQLESNYFSFPKKAIKGNYGASATAWYSLLTQKYGYGIVGIELENPDEPAFLRAEHNLWFVHGSLLERKQKRLASFADLTSMFWGAHFAAGQFVCLHAQHPCPLYNFLAPSISDDVGGLSPKDRAVALSNWMASTDVVALVAAQTFLKLTIDDQMQPLCQPEEGDSCLHESKVFTKL